MRKKIGLFLCTIILIVAFSLAFVSCVTVVKDAPSSKSYLLDYSTVYAMAQDAGYTGSLEDLIESFKGDSAYELAKKSGYTGSINDWLSSLKGAAGTNGVTPHIGSNKHWFVGEVDTGVLAEGKDGAPGTNGVNGVGIASVDKSSEGKVDTYTLTYTDGSTYSFSVTNGTDGINGTNGVNGTNGDNGENGKDGVGIRKVEKKGTEGLVDTYTIFFTNGTTFDYTITNGKDGENGSSSAIDPNAPTPAEYFRFSLLENDTYSIAARYRDMPSHIVIPSEYSGKSVTRIETDAFKGIASIDEVFVPASITKIGESAFENCSVVTLTFDESARPNGVPKSAFRGCDSLRTATIPSVLGSSVSGNPVERIVLTYGSSILDGEYAGCTTLKSITLNSDLKWICAGAFMNCTALTSVTIPDGVTSIRDNAFLGCTSLRSVEVPDSVSFIGESVFRDCTSLVYAKLPTGEGYVPQRSFYGCSSLEKVDLANDITAIDQDAFRECVSLYDITLPTDLISINESAFAYCFSLYTITIPANVKYIRDSAFLNCFRLVEIQNLSTFLHITAGVNTSDKIAVYAKNVYKNDNDRKLFTSYNAETGERLAYYRNDSESSFSLVYCKGNAPVYTIPGGITEINDFAFYNNMDIVSVRIPAWVTKIGSQAFGGCVRLMEVINESSALDIVAGSQDNGRVAYYAERVVTSSYEGRVSAGGEFVTYIKEYVSPSEYYAVLTGYTGSDTVVTVPKMYSEIGDYAFYGRADIVSVTIPHGITKIGDYAFYGCCNLSSIAIPASVTEIGSRAFYGCKGLISVKIDSPDAEIKDYAFYGCEKLESIALRDNVTLGNAVFYDCYSLKSVDLPEYIKTIGAYAFCNCRALTDITIPSGVTDIGAFAFRNCNALSSITFPYALETIGNYAFSYCKNLTSVVLFNKVRSIGDNAFQNCTNLTTLVVGTGVTELGLAAFLGCTELSSIFVAEGNPVYHSKGNCLIETDTRTLIMGCKTSEIPADGSVLVIGDSAFYMCPELYTIAIPDCVKTIESFAFFKCPDLLSVKLGSGVEEIQKKSFYDCRGMTSVTLPVSIESIGESAFTAIEVYYSGTRAQWASVCTEQFVDASSIHCIDD